jgi:hypothetical protein
MQKGCSKKNLMGAVDEKKPLCPSDISPRGEKEKKTLKI